MNAHLDSIRLCVFVGICGLTLFFAQEIYHANVRYKNLENELYDNQKSADEIIHDLKRKLSSVEFIRNETECLAKNIYFEAQAEPYQGKLAVATVTMNRVQSGKFPSTVCGVVLQKNTGGCQFSWVCDNKTDIVRSRKDYVESVEMAEEVLLSSKRSRIIPSDALYYHADYVKPYWAKTKKFFTKIGAHLFYRG